LNHPTPFDHFESLLPCFLPGDLQTKAGVRRSQLRQALVAVDVVPQYLLQSWQPFSLGPLEDGPGGLGIGDRGGSHEYRQQQSHRIHQDMAFDAVDPLVAVDAVVPTALRAFDTLAVHTSQARTRLSTGLLSHAFAEDALDFVPGAILGPFAEIR